MWAGTASPAPAQVPSESDVYVDRGIIAYDSQRYAEALQDFQEALRLNPNNVNAHYYSGLTFMALERSPEAQAALERARELAPGDLDVAFQLGLAYFTSQQFDRAEPLFRQVHSAEPARPNVGYYLGFIEFRRQAYREALRLFRASVPGDETFAQLTRFYAGLSLSALGLAGPARAEIDEAIRRYPVSPLTGPAERFREVLAPAVRAERDVRVEAKLSLFYDDNVAVVPRQSGDITAAALRDRDHRSTGELGYLRLEYLPLRTVDWEASLAASLFGTINNEASDFNVFNPAATGTLAYKTSLERKPALVGLSLQYEYIMLDGEGFVNRYSLPLFFTLAWDAVHLSQGQLRIQPKDFMNQSLVEPADDRDAVNYMAGLTHFFRFEADRHFLKVGYQFDYEAAQGANWDYRGHRFLVGGQYTLPWKGIRLRYDFDMHLRDYRAPHTFLPAGFGGTTRRSDQDMYHTFSISMDLPWNATLSVEYLLNRNFSTLDVFDYLRNVVSVSLSWRY
jgi:tetratricopeptide (TPR) repeat protein